MPESTSRVLITGGLGYLGGRITAHLMESNPHAPLRLLTRRTPDQIPLWAKQLDVVRGDLLDAGSLAAALEDVDTVIHLAAANEIESQRDPGAALDTVGKGTLNLLQACVAQNARRFIYFSTFHVYGPSADQPITEGTPARPVHPYAITHLTAEGLVDWHRHSYDINTLILRVSNGYGFPADPLIRRWTLVFNDLCRQAVEQGEIRLRSNGKAHRDYVAIGDVARAVNHFLSIPTESWEDGLFNLGGESSLSVLKVAEIVADRFRSLCGHEVPIRIEATMGPEHEQPVDYRIDKLKGTGFQLSGNMADEIDGTFGVCQQLMAQAARST